MPRPDPRKVAAAMCNGLALAVAHERITTPEALGEIVQVLHRFAPVDRQLVLDTSVGMFLDQRTAAESLALTLLVEAGANLVRARQLHDRLHAGPGGVMGLGDQL